ncbi:MAG: phosphonate C-P lyase system protein PhnH [Chloroflexota bacterium]|nr:phosphonate C-P lyase system protein PhnH [Chloroflexota bacterium]
MVGVSMNDQESRTLRAFTALMWALSHPGRVQPLPGTGLDSFFVIGETLVDLETSYYTSFDELDQRLARLGGRPRPPQEAMYQFYAELDDADLLDLQEAPVGTYACPDESATLVIGAEFGSGLNLGLSGPGIPGTAELSVSGIPDAFWPLREKMICYPLGWDVFLVWGGQVVGLPRTTVVEIV